jgi:hypothetical protein
MYLILSDPYQVGQSRAPAPIVSRRSGFSQFSFGSASTSPCRRVSGREWCGGVKGASTGTEAHNARRGAGRCGVCSYNGTLNTGDAVG